jgi:hypothetical protein
MSMFSHNCPKTQVSLPKVNVGTACYKYGEVGLQSFL